MDDFVQILPRAGADAEWIRETFAREWHGDGVELSDGRTAHADDVPALVAWRRGQRVGLAAFVTAGEVCEIVALVARPTGQGVGTALVDAVVKAAQTAGCVRLEVATTNDNLDALRFYQRRGFALAELHAGMMDDVRSRKPEVPSAGEFGIPLRDVLVLSRPL